MRATNADKTLDSRLQAARDRLDKAGINWAVFAGAAAHCYGSERQVTDIDILVREADLKNAEDVLKGVEGSDVIANMEISTDQGACLFFMDDDMIKHVVHKTLLGVTVPVIPVEDNILFKAILQRGENKGKHDIKDIQDMMNHEKIDRQYLKARMRKYNAERRTTPLLRRLGVL